MIPLFDTLRHKSQTALRSAVLTAAAAGLLILALGFAAGAIVLLLSTAMPLWGALLTGAGALAFTALLLLVLSGIRPQRAAPAQPASVNEGVSAALFGLAAQSGSLKDLILRLAEHEARSNPGAAAAIAAAAGLLLGALDAQRENKDRP